MDRMRTRRPTLKSLPSKAMREEFKPDSQWIEDPSNRYLLVQLPGYKREDLRVQLDGAGKLLIKGSRQVSENRYHDVNQSFDVPKDTIIEKISGRFEDECLTLTMPKRVVEKQEATQKAISEEKAKEPAPEEKPTSTVSEEKEKEPIPDEKPKGAEEKEGQEAIQEEEKGGEEKKDEAMHEDKPTSHEEKKDEPMQEEKPTTTEEETGPAQTEKPKTSEDYKDEAIQEDKPRTPGEQKYDGPALERKPEEEKTDDSAVTEEKTEGSKEKKEKPAEKKEESVQTEKAVSDAVEKGKETIQKVKSKVQEICADTSKELRKRISAWKGAEEKWLDSGSVDDILEKMNKNRKVIAVAVVAFSVGFYVSHKLKTSGR